MSMVEFGNNLVTEEGLDVLHNLLDFPMECLEEDEDAGNWDMSNMESLGPIPSNVLMPYEMFGFQRPNLFPKPVASINGVPELKQLPKHVDASSLHILPLRKFAEVQESPSCCTQSPVSVLESSGSHPREKSLSIKSCYVIPVKSRSKRVRHTGINPWLLAAHGLSTSKQAPNARKSRETRKKRCQQPFATGMLKNSPRNVDNTLDVSDPVHLQNHFKKCSHCQSTKTPQWRWGPSGRNSLCNACGVRYRSGRLFPEYRPAASPSFTQSQHSNSHKKVTELRNKANLSTAKTKIEIVRAPEGKHLTKHDDTSCSIFPLWNAEAPKQKKLAKYDITCCLHIPSQIEHANVDESCYHISILESSGSSSRERRLSFMSSRSKCVKPAGANPLLSALSCTSKRTSNASERDQSSKKLFERSVVVDVPKKCPKNDDDSLYVSDPVNLQNGPIFGKKCAHCESTKTPQWREGPSGPRTLCNACGVRYRSGRLVSEYRPAASPTFVPSKHSNLHSKVLQMINAVEHSSLRPEVKTKTSPQPE